MLDYMAQIQISRGELIAAAETLNRAFSIANAIDDQNRSLFYAYFDRAGDLPEDWEKNAIIKRTFEPCYEAHKMAQADYERAFSVAQKAQGMPVWLSRPKVFLQRLGHRRQLIQSQETFHKKVLQMAIFHPQKSSDVFGP